MCVCIRNALQANRGTSVAMEMFLFMQKFHFKIELDLIRMTIRPVILNVGVLSMYFSSSPVPRPFLLLLSLFVHNLTMVSNQCSKPSEVCYITFTLLIT